MNYSVNGWFGAHGDAKSFSLSITANDTSGIAYIPGGSDGVTAWNASFNVASAAKREDGSVRFTGEGRFNETMLADMSHHNKTGCAFEVIAGLPGGGASVKITKDSEVLLEGIQPPAAGTNPVVLSV